MRVISPRISSRRTTASARTTDTFLSLQDGPTGSGGRGGGAVCWRSLETPHTLATS
jgi:hypothetical protein